MKTNKQKKPRTTLANVQAEAWAAVMADPALRKAVNRMDRELSKLNREVTRQVMGIAKPDATLADAVRLARLASAGLAAGKAQDVRLKPREENMHRRREHLAGIFERIRGKGLKTPSFFQIQRELDLMDIRIKRTTYHKDLNYLRSIGRIK